MERVMVNKARCLKCSSVIESIYRLDYVTCSCGAISIDGGRDYYVRRCGDLEAIEDLSLTESSPHEKLRKEFTWGTRGIDGKEPLRFIPVEEMTKEHVQAVLDTQHQIPESTRKLFIKELEYREETN